MRDPSPSAAGCLTGALALAALTLAPHAATAGPRSPLAQGFLNLPPDEAAAELYATPDGDVRFTLDRSGPVMLLKFEGEDEVLALTATPGPRGDEFYKTDTGETLLRVTSLGGVIVYRDRAGLGAPAALEGRAEPLPRPGRERNFAARVHAMERRIAALLGRRVAVEAPASVGEDESGLILDALARAEAGLAANRAANVTRVVIDVGARPQARLAQDGALRVVVAPDLGYAGRPSTAAVRLAVSRERE